MLTPRRTKYRKQMRRTVKGNATAGTQLSFGEYGLLTLDTAWISSRQIEAARRSMDEFVLVLMDEIFYMPDLD